MCGNTDRNGLTSFPFFPSAAWRFSIEGNNQLAYFSITGLTNGICRELITKNFSGLYYYTVGAASNIEKKGQFDDFTKKQMEQLASWCENDFYNASWGNTRFTIQWLSVDD